MGMIIEIIGWLATIVTIGMYAPQSIKVIRAKKTEGLSKATFCLVAIGSIMWTIFGVAIDSWQVWTANGIVLILMIPIIYYLFKDEMAIFVLAVSILVAAFITTMILLAVNVRLNSTVTVIVSVFGGIGTGLPYVPQVIKTFRTKNISSISIMSTLGVIVANSLWVLYYFFRLIHNSFVAGDLIALMFSALGVATASSLAYIYYRYKNKN